MQKLHTLSILKFYYDSNPKLGKVIFHLGKIDLGLLICMNKLKGILKLYTGELFAKGIFTHVFPSQPPSNLH